MKKRLIIFICAALLLLTSSATALAASPEECACGDPSGDGKIDIADYTLIRLHILALKSLPEGGQSAADVDGDGEITIGDYTLVRLHILGLRDIGAGALPLSGRVIGIDPGHQAHANRDQEPIRPGGAETKNKVSSGTYGRFTGIREYVLNLEVALILKGKLEALGATVIMTRTTHEVDISNAERATMMNNAPVDCWVRIHADGSDDASKYGMSYLAPAEGCVNSSDPAVQQNSVRLAETMIAASIAATGAKNNGVKLRDDQTGFCWSSVPVCTIEMGYMTNETEDLLLATAAYKESQAQGMADGFVDYFN